MRRTFKILIALVGVLFSAFAIVGTTRASDEPQIIHVTLKDYNIELSRFTFMPGKAVEFLVANQGTMPHRFVVESYASANAINATDAPVIAAGTSRTMLQTFKPGIYRVTCDKWDHTTRGMVNAFAVEATSQKTVPIRIEFIIPILGLVLGSAYIVWDSLGLSLTSTVRH
jgi:uncharacterized cupredoxin-like copper-binding protein